MSRISKTKDTCNVICFKKELVSKLKKEIPPNQILKEVADTFSILGDKTRVKILFALSKEKELCVCDIANVLGLTISATSHQLRKLRDKGAVKFRNDGKMAYYSLNDNYIKNISLEGIKHIKRRKK